MSQPVFRNPDLYQVLPLREYLRGALPSGGDGCVIEDLDLLVRHYGPRYQLDSFGRFMLVEQKHPGSDIGTAQKRTFGLLHQLLRMADPDRKRYLGYYLLWVHFGPNNTPIFPITINRQHVLSEPDFLKWLNGETILPSLWP